MALVQKRSPLKIWGDVIFAIFLREIKSQSTDKIGLVWAVISPLIMIAGMTVMRAFMSGGGDAHGMPIAIFMVFGMVLIQAFLAMFTKCSEAINKNKPLYAFRQVQPIGSLLGVGLFELLVKVFVILTITIIAFVIKLEVSISYPIAIIINLLQVWLIGGSLGLMFGLAACYVPEIKKIQILITRPLFFISGIFFSLQDIPQEYWHYLTWNPLLHAVELTRYAAYPSYGNAGVSEFYLNMFTLGAVFFALACYHVSWKQAISR
jgi:capsular polysaccharide transport system permease protein